MRVMCFIRSLEIGGAETQLVNIASGLGAHGHEAVVVVFYAGGVLEDRLQASGVRLVSLKKRGRWDVIGFFLRFIRLVRTYRPDVIYSSLEGANIVAALSRPLCGGARVVWRIASAGLDITGLNWLSRSGYRLEDWFSGIPDAIVVNSGAGRDWVLRRGFPENRLYLVPNGIDTEVFRPDPAAGRSVREELGIPQDALVIGFSGRIDPVKRIDLLFSAVSSLTSRYPGIRVLCVGGGGRDQLDQLSGLAEQLGLSARVIWAGYRSDTPRMYNAMDLLCSCSDAEGFSNVVAEAMACEIPVVVTDVGDSARIVGDTGIVVSPGDEHGLARAITKLLELTEHDRKLRGWQGRGRITGEFGTERMVTDTIPVLLQAAAATGRSEV